MRTLLRNGKNGFKSQSCISRPKHLYTQKNAPLLAINIVEQHFGAELLFSSLTIRQNEGRAKGVRVRVGNSGESARGKAALDYHLIKVREGRGHLWQSLSGHASLLPSQFHPFSGRNTKEQCRVLTDKHYLSLHTDLKFSRQFSLQNKYIDKVGLLEQLGRPHSGTWFPKF